MSAKLPTFTLCATNRPVCFRFTASSPFGWAICTVNDATGELAVQSDWGSWCYRWHVESLGKPLTNFLASANANYVADKLAHEQANAFDGPLTVAALRKRLCNERLQEGTPLTKERARELWNELEMLEHCSGFDDLHAAFFAIEDCELITDEPWNYTRTAPTHAYNVLMHGIVPALSRACREYSARARETELQEAR